MDAAARRRHPVGRRAPAHRRDPAPGRGRRSRRRRVPPRRPDHRSAGRRRARHLRPRQGDAGRRRQPAVEAEAAADPAQRRLAGRPRRGLPGALPVLLSRRLAGRAARDPGLRRLDEILAGLDAYVGSGHVTTGTDARGHEGTTFEASCYTDPLGIEHLTGSLAATIAHVGTHEFAGPVQLRATTKFDDVAPLLDLPHGGRTRIRASVNSASAARFEGGTDPVAVRLAGLGRARPRRLPGGAHHRADHADRRLAGGVRRAARRGGRRARRRSRARPDRRVHHPPLHPDQQAGAGGLVPAHEAGDGPGRPHAQVRQVRPNRSSTPVPAADFDTVAGCALVFRRRAPDRDRLARSAPHPLPDVRACYSGVGAGAQP